MEPEITSDEILAYLKENMVTKKEFDERFAGIDKRLNHMVTKAEFADAVAGINQRLEGVNNRVDPLANDVAVLKNKVTDLEGS